MEYHVGQQVLYCGVGVCEIKEVVSRAFSGMESQQYFVLQPLFTNHAVSYLPVAMAEKRLRPLHSLEEMQQLLAQSVNEECIWQEDSKERKECYRNILREGDCEQTMLMLKALTAQKEKRKAIGKQLSSSDEENMKIGQRILHEEFAVLLESTPDKMGSYIREQLAAAQ